MLAYPILQSQAHGPVVIPGSARDHSRSLGKYDRRDHRVGIGARHVKPTQTRFVVPEGQRARQNRRPYPTPSKRELPALGAGSVDIGNHSIQVAIAPLPAPGKRTPSP